MIRVVFTQDKDGFFTEYLVEGHAGWAEEGHDIVCAAVSALVQTVFLGLERRLGLKLAMTREKGFFRCQLPQGMPLAVREKANLLVETLREGLFEIAKVYPQRIWIEDKVTG